MRFDRYYQILVAISTVTAMAALWIGSIIHYGEWDGAAGMLDDARRYPDGVLAGGISELVMGACLTIAVIGLAALVRGRGSVFMRVSATILGVGITGHVLGGFFHLILVRIAQADVARADALRVLDSVVVLQTLYFALLAPFLLGLILLPAALWRARAVSWQPFTLILADLVLGPFLTGDKTPADRLWWSGPIVTITAYAWLAVGIARYRPDQAATAAAPPATPAVAAPA